MTIIADLEYAPGMAGDLFLPDGPASAGGFPAALLIHGGGWTSMDRHAVRGIAEFLAGNGFAVFNIDYRLAPQHRWPAGLDDCKAAAQWLLGSEYPVDAQKFFIVGGSSGGHYSLMTGLTLPRGTVCGIVSISGIDDVFIDSRFSPGRYTALLGKSPDEKDLTEINPATYLTADAPPVLCTHWRRDEVVRFAACTAFEQAAADKGVKISVYSYDFDREFEGHGIWIPGTSPRRMYPDLEAVILAFMKEVISK
jgi:acetyl esterase/lipase